MKINFAGLKHIHFRFAPVRVEFYTVDILAFQFFHVFGDVRNTIQSLPLR